MEYYSVRKNFYDLSKIILLQHENFIFASSMKVIIPVAGVGTRLRPHTNTQPKALVPVAGKAIIAHIVDNLIAAGMKEFIFIVSYMGDKIESYIRSRYADVKCE